MKKVNENEMRNTEGGTKYSYTAKCSICGKKYKVTGSYYELLGYIIMTNTVKVAAERKARDCEYSHF